jgi:hypothetical protein
MSIGGEWFGMWMSEKWNGVPDAFRFFVTILMVLIYRWCRIDPTTLSRVGCLKHTVAGLAPGLFQLFQAVSKRCETGNY